MSFNPNYWNKRLENAVFEVPKILEELLQEFNPSEVCFSTSLGQEDQVLTHILSKISKDIYYFTLDTGRLFSEVYDLMDKTSTRYGIEIDSIHPEAQALNNLIKSQGNNGFYHGIEQRKNCCEVRKMQGLRKAIAGKKLWITGLRAEQSENRKKIPALEWDEKNNLFKLHPLMFWSQEDLNGLIKAHNIPVNPLHKKGFVSIGCQPCTRAILEGEDFRAGRWWWENSKKECGLHD